MADALARTCAVIEQGIAEGLHLGAQLFVQREDRVIANLAMGDSRPGVAMTVDTINPWLSGGKPLAAVAIAQLQERNLLDWDDRVVKFIPEFGTGGKEPITIRHILTHTAGFRAVIGLQRSDPYEVAIQKICAARLEPNWIIGQTAGYHPLTSWYVLGEIVHRIDGRMFDRYVREEISLPLGMNDSWMTIDGDAYRNYGERIGFIYDTSKGQPISPPHENDEASAANLRPGASARGPIRELGRFYQMLRDGGESLLQPASVQMLTAAHRRGIYDLSFKQVMDWGLGFIVNTHPGTDQSGYGYGPLASPQTFGHSGNQSSCGFCDPTNNLIAAWFCNGMPDQARHAQRQRRINEAIYEDLRIRR
jgi:CubicO group peptidase (beta-lactamase class C family)